MRKSCDYLIHTQQVNDNNVINLCIFQPNPVPQFVWKKPRFPNKIGFNPMDVTTPSNERLERNVEVILTCFARFEIHVYILLRM